MLTNNATQEFFTTTDDTADFDHHAAMLFSASVKPGYAEIKC